MKKDFKKTFRGIDALIKKMLFDNTCNDIKCECYTKWPISLQLLNLMPSPKKDRSSVLSPKTLEFAIIFNHNRFSLEAQVF